MLAFQASGTGSIPVRCIIFLSWYSIISATLTRAPFSLVFCVYRCLSHCPFRHLSIPMRLPQLKRRRVLSNPLAPLLTPTLLVASLKPSRISTCTSCHRTIKPSPPLVCARFVVVPFAPMPTVHYACALSQMQRINMRHLCAHMYRWSSSQLSRDWHSQPITPPVALSTSLE
jgi:hypothetical protein